MKIADIGQISKDTQSLASVQEKQPVSDTGLSFRRQITDLSEAHYKKYIEELKDKIFEQGETIKKKSDIGEFVKYRKLIAELVGEAASNAYESSKSSAFDARGKHKIFIQIKKVNVKLDEMAQEIISQQKDNIKLLQMVDDIRGLLVDMFL